MHNRGLWRNMTFSPHAMGSIRVLSSTGGRPTLRPLTGRGGPDHPSSGS